MISCVLIEINISLFGREFSLRYELVDERGF